MAARACDYLCLHLELLTPYAFILKRTLSALLGIFVLFYRRFEVYYLYGLPFMDTYDYSPAQPEHGPPTLACSFVFMTQEDSIRNEHFPSWSWAAWNGSITWYPYYNSTIPSEAEPCIAIESEGIGEMSWIEYRLKCQGFEDDPSDQTIYIHVQAIISPLLNVRELGPRELHPMLPSEGWVNTIIYLPNDMRFSFGTYNGPGALFSAYKMHEIGLDNLRLACFANQTVAQRPDDGHTEGVVHLLLRNAGTHWERFKSVIGEYETRDGSAIDSESWPGTLEILRLG